MIKLIIYVVYSFCVVCIFSSYYIFYPLVKFLMEIFHGIWMVLDKKLMYIFMYTNNIFFVTILFVFLNLTSLIFLNFSYNSGIDFINIAHNLYMKDIGYNLYIQNIEYNSCIRDIQYHIYPSPYNNKFSILNGRFDYIVNNENNFVIFSNKKKFKFNIRNKV